MSEIICRCGHPLNAHELQRDHVAEGGEQLVCNGRGCACHSPMFAYNALLPEPEAKVILQAIVQQFQFA